MPTKLKAQFWLVQLDVHGNPTLKDGSWSSKSEVEEAFKLHTQLGFTTGKSYAIAQILLEPLQDTTSNN